MACRNRADTRRVAQNAVTALVADLMEIAGAVLYADEKRIQRGNSRLAVVGSYFLHSEGARHHQETIRALNRAIVFRQGGFGHGIAGSGDNRTTCYHLSRTLEAFLHGKDFIF